MAAAVTSYDRIKDDALHLPLDDRSRLASRLLESLEEDDEVSAEWLEEIRRRVKSIDDGTTKLIPSEEVWKKVNESFGTSL